MGWYPFSQNGYTVRFIILPSSDDDPMVDMMWFAISILGTHLLPMDSQCGTSFYTLPFCMNHSDKTRQ